MKDNSYQDCANNANNSIVRIFLCQEIKLFTGRWPQLYKEPVEISLIELTEYYKKKESY